MKTFPRNLIALATMVVLFLVASVAGCVSPLPQYSERGVAESLAVLADRSEGIRSISGAGTLTVRSPDRGAVTLEAAVVVRRPDQLRVRAWKMGRSMVDLLLDGERVEATLDRRVGEGELTEGLRGLREVLLSIDSGFYLNAAERPSSNGNTLVVRGMTSAGVGMICEIDRATLTTRRVRVENAGAVSESFALERYRVIEGIAWPTRIRAQRGEHEATLRFDWVEFNAEIPSGVLPPVGAIIDDSEGGS